ncbi:CPBP family intramembrane glutamic endopeptidase, partial [Sphingomonas bacterium]|uniref:CPBP family intramembrane glutamic endopeptidase n=1 Tax=Sphingomonas bacterium TaxID=1895847 RepID=UPI001576483D
GVAEEMYFRLLLPLLGTQAFGHPVMAFAGAALLFGAGHHYQGWRGVVSTTITGGVLTIAYLATTSLLLVMAVHAAGDLMHLVARPAVRRRVKRWLSLRHLAP